MTPQQLQMAAAAMMQNMGTSNPQQMMGAGGGRGMPMPPPQMPQEDEPGWNPATMGNQQGMMQGPTGGMMPDNLDAILRRLGGPPQLPGAVPGEHQGLSELLGQGHGIDPLLMLLQNSMPDEVEGRTKFDVTSRVDPGKRIVPMPKRKAQLTPKPRSRSTPFDEADVPRKAGKFGPKTTYA